MRALIFFKGWGKGPQHSAQALAQALSALLPESEVDISIMEACCADRTGLIRRYIAMEEDWRYRTAHDQPMPIPWRIRRKVISYLMRIGEHNLRMSWRNAMREIRPEAVIVLSGIEDWVSKWWAETGDHTPPLVSVSTDFDVMPLDLSLVFDSFVVGTGSMARHLAGKGIPLDRIVVAGIPIDRAYGAQPEGDTILREMDLPRRDGRSVVLLQAHSGGKDFTRGRLEHLLETEVPCDIVVAGVPNPGDLTPMIANVPKGHRVRILGFTERMPELLAAADVVITKPGGLMTAQAIASGCALILLEPLPGPEQGNVAYLLRKGAAIRVYSDSALPVELTHLLRDDGQLALMQASADHAARRDSAEIVASQVIKLVQARAGSLESGQPR